MTMGDWVFNVCTPRETKTEDALAEFFNTLDFDRREEYLVRESFQNSNDAAHEDDGRVHIRIFISGEARSLPPKKAAKYFGGLQEHLIACPSFDTDWSALFSHDCEFVVIEDFGTTGLTGDERAGIHTEGEKNAFYHFWRTSARTDKDASSGKAGSWGVGKFVYIMSSQLRTMFGLTVRKSTKAESSQLLFGQIALKYHTLGETIYSKHGYFGEDSGGEDVTAPYSGDSDLALFKQDWCLARGNEHGLSVVIPYCQSINSDSLLFSIIKEYGGRILMGRLTVDLDAPEGFSGRVDESSIFEILKDREHYPEWREVQALMELLRDYEENRNIVHIGFPLVTSGQGWKEMEIPQSILEDLIDKFRNFGTVCVRVPLQVERKNGMKEQSHFDVLLRSEEGGDPIAPVFYRSGLRISGKQMSTKSNGVRSVFISGGGILGEMLRLSEGPAHTEWSPDRENFKNRYKNDAVWIRFCRTAPKKVVELARGGSGEQDLQSLADLFPDPDHDSRPTNKPKSPVDQGGGMSGGVTVDQVGQVPVRLSKTDGGFVLRLQPNTKAENLEVEIVYARIRGNSFSKWSPLDFDVTELDVSVTSGTVLNRDKNQIQVEISDAESFQLEVTGFDSRRDIRVRASDLAAVTK